MVTGPDYVHLSVRNKFIVYFLKQNCIQTYVYTDLLAFLILQTAYNSILCACGVSVDSRTAGLYSPHSLSIIAMANPAGRGLHLLDK